MTKTPTANNGKTMPQGKRWQKGQSGNPKGRPKDGESWAAIIKAVGEMYPADIIAFVGENNDLGIALKKMPTNVQMKYLVTARVFAQLMFEPTSTLWKELMERVDGKVKEQIDITSNGNTLGQADDARAEIQRKLASIATSGNAIEVSE